jgi:hypothetical protein
VDKNKNTEVNTLDVVNDRNTEIHSRIEGKSNTNIENT